MATKENYDMCMEVLNHYIYLIKETGSLTGMAYSFSPRKVQLDYLRKNIGIVIRKDKIFVHKGTLHNGSNDEATLERVFNDSEAFQRACTGEYVCDKEMENLLVEMMYWHNEYIKDSLLVGFWEVK